MHPLYSPSLRKSAGVLAAACGVLTAALIGYGYVNPAESWQARLIPAHLRGEVPWMTITTEDIIAGRSVPAHSHVIFSLPPTMKHTSLDVLLGYRGQTVRYWGYCFPDNPEAAAENRRSGLPGVVFMSDRERKTSDARYQATSTQRVPVPNIVNPDSDQRATAVIRHQKESFSGGETCYLMTDQPLPIGLDEDGDLLNSRLERDYRTNPTVKDTDEDGVNDGYEVLRSKTNPLLMDSDSDGLIDGIEDKNRNGRLDQGETSPKLWDTDRDELCDGYCVINNMNRQVMTSSGGTRYEIVDLHAIVGEDKNLNGRVDAGETDPLKVDTDGDGIYDNQEYFNCLLSGQTNC